MDNLKKAVFFAGFCLFVLWLWPNIQMLSGDQGGTIRLVLVGFFALLILLRLKPRTSRPLGGVPGIVGTGFLGAILTVTGLMFRIHQFEWLGIIFVLYACLRWSLPDRWSADIVRSFFVLYWIHPLPGRLFGWFEVLMQKLSVWGSEWLLHILNVRVWAQGIYLHTGHQVFGVPEECSGMRTAVTMLICVLGVSILFKQRWWETLAFMVIGSLQALILNITRITFMVIWAERMPPGWSDTFLHNSLGIFLLAAIFIIQVEMSWWKVHVIRATKLQAKIDAEEVEPPDQASAIPRIWYLILKYAKWAVLILLVVLGCMYAAYKRRPIHRATMIADVVDGLMETNLPAAEAALADALSYTPKSRSLLSKKAHVLLLRRKYNEALAVIEALKPPLDSFETVMKSWILMSLKRPEAAIEIVNALPESQQKSPGIAIVKAEYGAMMNHVGEVSSNVLIAAGSSFPTERIRALYPYLAMHEQWSVIADSNALDIPHANAVSALIVLQAYIKTGDMAAASLLLDDAIQRWPDDARFMDALYYMAVRRPGTKWERLFTDSFIAHISRFTVDEAAYRMSAAFQLGRPDLGWLAYRRLESLDPSDPELLLAPVRYGGAWFRFRCKQLGIQIKGGIETIDLAPFVRASSCNSMLRSYWDRIPLVDELSRGDQKEARAKYLEKAIAGYETRIASGKVSKRLETSYPVALGIAGRFADARGYLDKLAAKYPERRPSILFQHADFYHAERKWDDSYEYLRKYFAAKEDSSLTASLMLVDDLMSMNMGVYALDVVRDARTAFPDARELDLAEASVWDAFGFKDRALRLLGSESESRTMEMRMRLLYETGRYREAERVAIVLSLPKMDTSKISQRIALPPAELMLRNIWSDPFSMKELEDRLATLNEARKRVTSPFVRDLIDLEEAFLKDGSASVGGWAAVGRDAGEKASALHRLALIAGRQKRYELAEQAVRAALTHLPKSPILWRMLIALTEGERSAIQEARISCPGDPDIWLASVVASAADAVDKELMLKEVRDIAESGKYPAESLIRAGEFLLKKGYDKSAYVLAEAAGAENESLLAADMLELRCALVKKDVRWATESSLKGVEHSLDPGPFYEMIVGLKSAGRTVDADLIGALEHLKAAYPENKRWPQELGMVYFEKGDTVRALSVLNAIIKEDIRSVTALSFMLAAEAARIDGDSDRSIDILRAAYALYPETSVVLNNLVYGLAQDPATLDEAVSLLPALGALKDKTFHVYDTMAMVCMKNGQFNEAEKNMKKALETIDAKSYSADEVKLNSAELLLNMGAIDAAESRLNELMVDQGRSDMVDRKARKLLERIRSERKAQ